MDRKRTRKKRGLKDTHINEGNGNETDIKGKREDVRTGYRKAKGREWR